MTSRTEISDVMALVQQRKEQVRRFLIWAHSHEISGWSFRWRERPDIKDAAIAGAWFPNQWWGVTVFTCFGSLKGVQAVRASFEQPLTSDQAWGALQQIVFERGSIGHHRIQPAHKGAKIALVSACQHAQAFRQILLSGETFNDRFESLQAVRAPQWGRTTCFDLLLRAAALRVGGQDYAPDRAYLAGSTGPAAGFENVWGTHVTWSNADRCESILRQWSDNWRVVCDEVGVEWSGDPYAPADFENALCIYQERKWGGGA